MRRMVTRAALSSTGALLGVIGGALMFSPRAFLETSHVFVEQDPGLMSELTAPGVLLLVAGILMVAGAVRIRIADLGLSVGAVIYGSYGVGRLVSMAFHGVPPDSLVAATVIELAISVLLVSLRRPEPAERLQRIAEAYIGGVIV